MADFIDSTAFNFEQGQRARAGIDPNERVVKGLMEFVSKGIRTSVALSREESERRHAMELDQAEAA